MAFLGDQIVWEALDLVDVPEFRAVVVDVARYAQAPATERIARYGVDFDPRVFKTISSRLTAWAGEQLDDASLRQRAWEQFTTDRAAQPWPAPVTVRGNAVTMPVDEIPARNRSNPSGDFATFSTNEAAQRALAIIALLALAPDEAP